MKNVTNNRIDFVKKLQALSAAKLAAALVQRLRLSHETAAPLHPPRRVAL